jgi:cell fate (sporulation/competence/biofilm development) regulator YlbF (YheA/YmcA/DUF963 family)
MSIMERQALDFSMLISKAYDLGHSIEMSTEVAAYLYWKDLMNQDQQVKHWIIQMNKAKERFADCERYGHFHPNYHEALDQVRELEAQGDAILSIYHFKKAEQELDQLLYEISSMIAHSVSPSIKVPSNDPMPKSGGCGSGGSCNCGG